MLIRLLILSDLKPGMRRSGMRGINAIRITGRLLSKSIPIGADIASVNIMTRIFIISTIAARGKVGIKDSMASVHLQRLLVMKFVLRWTLVTAFVTPEVQVMAVLSLGQLLPASVLQEPLLVMKFVLLEPRFMTPGPQVVLAYNPPAPLAVGFVTPEPQAPAALSLGQLLPASVALEPLVLPFRNRELLVLAFVLLGQLLLGSVPLEPLVLLAYKPLEPRVTEPLPLPRVLVNLKNLLVVRKNRSSSSAAGASSQIAPPGRSGIIFWPNQGLLVLTIRLAAKKERRFQTIRGNENNGHYLRINSP